MQIPYRKPGKYSQIKNDPLLTADKVSELEKKLAKLKTTKPQAMAEVARLAELGDFSENMEYQLAKGRLRGINDRILKLENQINHAIIITPQKRIDTIKIGHSITIENENGSKKYQILGSTESDPAKGIISYNSPMGQALLGCKLNEIVKIKIANKETAYKIKQIE